MPTSSSSRRKFALLVTLLCQSLLFSLQVEVSALTQQPSRTRRSSNEQVVSFGVHSRRSFAEQIVAVGTVGHATFFSKPAVAAGSLEELKETVKKARGQLDAVPAIIEKQEWDKVRAILITPPLSDFWTTTKRGSNILMDIASAVGDAGGDELSILELREEVQSHLRYLDMAVYNNVFNPISSQGETGATKQLIQSYYEDPKNELKASQAALDGILAEIP